MPITQHDQRRHDRLDLPAAYAGVRVRRPGRVRYSLRGHAYDLSTGGLQIELDRELDPGELIDVQLSLPGARPATLRATGRVVRLCAPEIPGPVRMGLRFTRVTNPEALTDYIRRADCR